MSILDALQAKVNAVDSSTAMSEILQLMYNVKEHPYKNQYDSAGLMPLDSAFIGSMAYAENRNAMYMLVGIDSGWKLIDSDAATVAASGGLTGPFHYQGSNYGYTAGGTPGYKNEITKYSYTSDGNSTDVGDLTVARIRPAGQSSSAHGYASGGTASGPSFSNVIDKWTFPSDANAADVGNLTVGRDYAAGASSSTHGYTGAGANTQYSNVIDKYPFSSDANATDVGDANTAVYATVGNQSPVSGYIAGGYISPGGNKTDELQKYPFAADANASDVANLTADKADHGGSSSSSHGYVYGGRDPGAPPQYDSNVLEKFSMVSDANATDVADLDQAGKHMVGTQSTTHGYYAGVNPGTPNYRIAKFPFASDTDGVSDVGDTSVYLFKAAGAQY